MIALLVLGCIFCYIVIGSAVWVRMDTPKEMRPPWTVHRDLCGEPYTMIHTCKRHKATPSGAFDPECDACWTVSYANHTYGCQARRLKAEVQVGRWAGAVLWPLALPIWIGFRIGKGKRVYGRKVRRATTLAKRIADMETEIFGQTKEKHG